MCMLVCLSACTFTYMQRPMKVLLPFKLLVVESKRLYKTIQAALLLPVVASQNLKKPQTSHVKHRAQSNQAVTDLEAYSMEVVRVIQTATGEKPFVPDNCEAMKMTRYDQRCSSDTITMGRSTWQVPNCSYFVPTTKQNQSL